jgi:lysozyme
MKYSKKIIDHFVFEEGIRLNKYLDTTNHWTIGIGHKLTPEELKNNLSSITKEQAYEILEKDLDEALKSAKRIFPEYDTYSENVQLALLDMAFNLGYGGLSKFVVTIPLIKQRKFKEAAEQAMKSLWARQVPNRAKRVTKLLASG